MKTARRAMGLFVIFLPYLFVFGIFAYFAGWVPIIMGLLVAGIIGAFVIIGLRLLDTD